MANYRTCIVAALLASALPTAALAQDQAGDFAELKRELEALKAEQAKANGRIAELEGALARANAGTQLSSPAPAAQPAPALAAAPSAPSAKAPSRLALSGDVRMRYESNFGDADAPDRNRLVLRARLRGSYAVSDWLSVGAQLATGDPNDPNTTDITLTGDDNKLMVSLDQAYIRAKSNGFQLDLGRIAQPFVRTELVWDGDVSPQGAAASYSSHLGANANIKASAMYFMVDEAAAAPDSDMIGGQVGFDVTPFHDLKLELTAGYYDYSLRSVAGADSGDFRSNILINGRYASDFDLLDIVGAINYSGFGAKWPLRIVGDYVKNFGASSAEDSGLGVDVVLGRASKPHDLRFTYGYAQAETDAVLAAFSHDNTNIATNYRQHTLGLDYTLTPNLILNATYYRYKPLHSLHAGTNDPNDWLNRLRLNALVNF